MTTFGIPRGLLLLAGSLLVLGAALQSSTGCSEEQAQETTCDPGTELFCRCPGGDPGTKLCLGDGESYGECRQGADIPCSDDRPTEQLCTPGKEFFCKCISGDSGVKQCTPEGDGFSECRKDATTPCPGGSGSGGSGQGGSGQGGSGQGGSTGVIPLYEACLEHADCQSGVCIYGYCTKQCQKVSDCELGAAECVDFDGLTVCQPVCDTQKECDKYGPPSECGYTKAIDEFPVTTCADWTKDLQHPPKGTQCQDHEDCNLGHEGTQNVCGKFTEVCIDGSCYADFDCPKPKTCSEQTGSLGKCI